MLRRTDQPARFSPIHHDTRRPSATRSTKMLRSPDELARLSPSDQNRRRPTTIGVIEMLHRTDHIVGFSCHFKSDRHPKSTSTRRRHYSSQEPQRKCIRWIPSGRVESKKIDKNTSALHENRLGSRRFCMNWSSSSGLGVTLAFARFVQTKALKMQHNKARHWSSNLQSSQESKSAVNTNALKTQSKALVD